VSSVLVVRLASVVLARDSRSCWPPSGVSLWLSCPSERAGAGLASRLLAW